METTGANANSESPPSKIVDADFDGHLEWPLAKMTVAQRLDWAWEMMLLNAWARNDVVKLSDKSVHEPPPNCSVRSLPTDSSSIT